MSNTTSLPSLIDFLPFVDDQHKVSVDEMARKIATISLTAALGKVYGGLSDEQKQQIGEIVKPVDADGVQKIVERLNALGKSGELKEELAEETNYWTLDYMLTICNNLSGDKRKLVEEKFPELKKIADEVGLKKR